MRKLLIGRCKIWGGLSLLWQGRTSVKIEDWIVMLHFPLLLSISAISLDPVKDLHITLFTQLETRMRRWIYLETSILSYSEISLSLFFGQTESRVIGGPLSISFSRQLDLTTVDLIENNCAPENVSCHLTDIEPVLSNWNKIGTKFHAWIIELISTLKGEKVTSASRVIRYMCVSFNKSYLKSFFKMLTWMSHLIL